MKKVLCIFIFFMSFLFAQDTNLIVKQKKALYIQNMIELEEKIAFEYEKYLLSEFKIPTMADLMKDGYLGTNFSHKNTMSSSKVISFKSSSDLKIKFAIDTKTEDYLVELYVRDLYRDRTSVLVKKNSNGLTDSSLSYVKILLKSDEAKTIYKILTNEKKEILKSCNTAGKVKKYCNKNTQTIRWHYGDSSWIEYSKKNFNNDNVTIRNVSITDDKFDDLVTGTYVYVENGPKYLKLPSNILMKIE